MRLLLVLLIPVALFSQAPGTINGDVLVKGNLVSRVGTGSPNGRDNCTILGAQYFQTDATAGSNNWACTTVGTPGTWTVEAGGSSGITQLTGDVTAGPGSGSQAVTLANSGVTPGACGDTTHSCGLTVDAKGRVTAQSNNVIAGGGGGGGPAPFETNITDCQVVRTSATVLTVNGSNSSAAPCNVKVGTKVTPFNGSATITLGVGAGTGSMLIYFNLSASSPALEVAYTGIPAPTCSGMSCPAPINSAIYPSTYKYAALQEWGVTVANTYDATGTPRRAAINAYNPHGGSGIAVTANADGGDNFAVDATVQRVSVVTFAGAGICTGTNEGQTLTITDSTVTTWGTTIAGGSTNHVGAYCNGTNWTVYAK